MIIANYSAFRAAANLGGAARADGLTEFDPTLMRAAGFDDGFSVSSSSEFPITIVVVGPNIMVVTPTDYYDWYVSQGTSISADKPLAVTRGNSDIGDRIVLDLSAWAATEYPDPFDISTIPVLFFAIDVYVIRRSDNAIQRLDLKKYLFDANAPTTDIG